MKTFRFSILILAWVAWMPLAQAQTTYTATNTADVFLATGSTGNPAGSDLTALNFGGAGTLVVASASSVKGEFQSVIRFDLAGAPRLFDTTYGTNNWSIDTISLELASNYGTAGVQPNNSVFGVISGGQFVIEWLSDDDWAEGTGTPNLPSTDGISFNSLPDLLSNPHEILSTNTYAPPGNNIHVTWPLPLNAHLVPDISSGGIVSLRFYAADDKVNYLFNSAFFGRGNEPLIHVTASSTLPPRIVSGVVIDTGFQITATGAPNGQYHIQTTAALAPADWQTLESVTADAEGHIQYRDLMSPGKIQQFYRLAR
ncbi:MAG TPA: hypothetical protein VMF06_18850 [Candidatus Limnocylindria bacterium]|nr:hypothetical protein [Candidatus Limnocylindria bacterium]